MKSASYAFTVWQPWASLIVLGLKPDEFRTWAVPSGLVGRRVVIHAGSPPAKINVQHLLASDRHIRYSCGPLCDVAKIRAYLEGVADRSYHMERGAGLGTAVLGEPLPVNVAYDRRGWPIGEAGPWNVAWPMLEVEAWPEPVPCRGAQGFWRWHHD